MKVFDKFYNVVLKILRGQTPDEKDCFEELEYHQMLSILQTFQFLCVYESYPPFADAQKAKEIFLKKDPQIEKSEVFPDLQARFFSERGELKNLSNLNYKEFLFQLRNEIAHHRFTTYIVENIRAFMLRINKRNFDISGIFNDKFIEYLSEVPFREKVSNIYRFLYVPKWEKQIETEEECEKKIKNCKIIKISFEKPTLYQGVKEKVFEVLSVAYSIGADIGQIKKNLSKKFDKDTKIEISSLPETRALTLRIAKDKNFYHFNPDPQLNVQLQDNFIAEIVEKAYDFSIVENRAVNNHGKIAYLTVQPQMLHDMICVLKNNLAILANKSQTKLDTSLKHFAPECAFLLCELNILDKMVITKYADTAKHAYFGIIMSAESLKQIPGTMRQIIQYSNMDNFEIVGKHHNKKKPESLNDKDYVLRKIRNSVHTQGMSFQLNKSGNFENIHINFQNPTQDNPLHVVVEFSQLKIFLDKFIKELEEKKQDKYLCKEPQVMFTDKKLLYKNAKRVCMHTKIGENSAKD